MIWDTFTGANGTAFNGRSPNVGGAWSDAAGAWNIQGNSAQPTGVTGFASITGPVSGRMRVSFPTKPSSDNFGVRFKSVNATNFCVVQTHAGGTLWAMFEVVGGSPTHLNLTAVPAVNGDVIDVWWQGTSVGWAVNGAAQTAFSTAAGKATAQTLGLSRSGALSVAVDNLIVRGS